jgi:exopolysaccharide biosynthesis polyprenyl glycosylphosphotransferase
VSPLREETAVDPAAEKEELATPGALKRAPARERLKPPPPPPTPEERSQRRRLVRALARNGNERPNAVAERDSRDILEGQRTPVVLRRDARVRRALAIADVITASIAMAVALAISGVHPRPAAVAAPLVLVLFCKLGRLYDRDEHVVRKSTLDQAPELAQASTVFTLIVWLASDLFSDRSFTKASIAAMLGILVVGLIAFRYVARRIASRSTTPERLLVLGNADAAQRLGARLERAHAINAELVGRVALDRDDREEPTSLGPLDDLDYVLRLYEIERVVIAPNARTLDEQLDTIRLVKSLGVKVSVLPRLFEVIGSSMEFDDVDGITVLGLRRYGLSRTSWYVKRMFDVVLASAGIAVLSPLLVAIAAAIRLTSPGPILFRQPRVGRRGTRFEMFKFRTMYDGADEDKEKLLELSEVDGMFKLRDDPRVTPVGRILRRTSLDELPQLINVLRGEMSLVGPRPLIEEEDRKIAGWHHRRREGTPGMTGVWQVLGSARVPLDDMVKMDYLYRANWSLWLDVKILLRTLAHVCGRRGA